MPRGVSKQNTGKQHLDRNNNIVAKKKRELEETKKQTEELTKVNEQKAIDCEKLNKESHDKHVKVNRENGSAILSGLSNLAGKGKYAKMEAENEKMRQLVAQIPYKMAERTAEQEKVCERERQIAELRLDEYNKLTRSHNRLLKKSKNDNSTYEFNLSQRDYAIAILKNTFQKMVELLDVVCNKALQTFIDFAKRPNARRFTYEQASAVNDFLEKDIDRQHAADTLSIISRPFLTENEHTKGRLEVQNVVKDFDEYERIEKKTQR